MACLFDELLRYLENEREGEKPLVHLMQMELTNEQFRQIIARDDISEDNIRWFLRHRHTYHTENKEIRYMWYLVSMKKWDKFKPFGDYSYYVNHLYQYYKYGLMDKSDQDAINRNKPMS